MTIIELLSLALSAPMFMFAYLMTMCEREETTFPINAIITTSIFFGFLTISLARLVV